MFKRCLIGLAGCAALQASPTFADDGHDHGAPPAAATGPAMPRFTASSELFELVGVVNGRLLTVYLDRFDDNAPVKGAKVELELGGAKVAMTEHADGEFEATLVEDLKAGLTPVTATIVAGSDSDLLVADVEVATEAHGAHADAHGSRAYAGWALAAAASVAALVWSVRQARARRRAEGTA